MYHKTKSHHRFPRTFNTTHLLTPLEYKNAETVNEDDTIREEEENASAISNRLSEFTTAKIIIGLLFMMLAMMLINPGEDETISWAEGIEQMGGTCSAYENNMNQTECDSDCITSIREQFGIDFVERHSTPACVNGECCDGSNILSLVVDDVEINMLCDGVNVIPNPDQEASRRSTEVFEYSQGNYTVVVDQKNIRDDEALSSILMTTFIIVRRVRESEDFFCEQLSFFFQNTTTLLQYRYF